MKSIYQMTTDEKLLLLDRAEQWAEAYPSLMASVKSWEDAPVKDVDEGLTLCRVLAGAESFLSSARLFEVKSCLTQIKIRVDEIIRIVRPLRPRTDKEIADGVKFQAFIPKDPEPDEDGTVNKITEQERLKLEQEAMDEEEQADRWRPQNLKEYIHLLSSQTQMEAARVKEMFYMPMREARARMESLAENPDATDEQRKEAAQRLVKAEEKLAAFWHKVDCEYAAVTGRELPEDFTEKEKKLSDYTKEEIDCIEDEELREKMKQARIENNKKYLRRKDLPDNEETRIQLQLRMQEQEEWGVKIAGKQMENLKSFGIVLEEGEEGVSEI